MKFSDLLASDSQPLALPRQHRLALFSLYVLANLYSAWLFIAAGATTNEFQGLSVSSGEIIVSCAVSIFFLFGVVTITYPLIEKVVCDRVKAGSRDRGIGIGYVVMSILTAQITFSIASGSQVAGQLIYLDSVWAWFFLIINGDYIFLAYYCFYRDSRWSYVNMALYLALGLVRGWGGVFLILGFLEIGRQLRLKRYRNIFIVAITCIFLAPVVYVLRAFARSSGDNMQGKEVLQLFEIDTFQSASEFEGVFSSLESMVDIIFLRLQHVEVDLVIRSMGDSLATLYANSSIRPFWAEGLIGKSILVAFDTPVQIDLHQVLPAAFHGTFEFLAIGYNVHVGLGSWSILLGPTFIFVLVYAFLLMAIGAILCRLNGDSAESRDVTWLMALLFICSGWFSPYEAFLQALIFVIAVDALCRHFVGKTKFEQTVPLL